MGVAIVTATKDEKGNRVSVLRNDDSAHTASKRLAIARWETDGGAGHGGSQRDTVLSEEVPIPDLTNAELVQMRIRIIALENIVIALLSSATLAQRQAASDIMGLIVPQSGAHPHPLTLHAATQMERLLGRAEHFAL